MNVLLVVPGNLEPHGVHLEDKFDFAVENLGLGSLAAMLQMHEIPCMVVDGYAYRQTWQETLAQVLKHAQEPCLIGFSVLQASAEATRLMVQGLREAGCDAPVVLGGWLPTAAPRETMEYIPQADFLLQGETEHTLVALVAALEKAGMARKEALGAIGGLLWRGSDGTLEHNPGAPSLIDLESLPFAHHYLQSSESPALRAAPLPMQSSRGCYWGVCTFCSTAGRYGHKGWRFRSAEHLMQELLAVVDAYEVSHISFIDDSFLGPSEAGYQRTDELIERLKDARLPIQFSIDCLIRDVEPGLFTRLYEVGLRQVFIGVDSGSDRSLKRFRKGFNTKQALESVRILKEIGLEAVTGFIGFEPYMTLEEVRENIEFLAFKLDHDGNPAKYLRRYIPNHATPLCVRLEKDGLLTGAFPDWSFRFREPQVQRLYDTLMEESAPLRNAYLDEGLYRAQSTEEIARRDALNEAFLSLFEDAYARACG